LRLTGTGRLFSLFSTEFFSLQLTRPLLLGRCCPSLRPLRLPGAQARGLLALLAAEFLSLRLSAWPLRGPQQGPAPSAFVPGTDVMCSP
jgi:hypothetical protein